MSRVGRPLPASDEDADPEAAEGLRLALSPFSLCSETAGGFRSSLSTDHCSLTTRPISASNQDADPERSRRVPLPRKPFIICNYKLRASKSFIICNYKLAISKPFIICNYAIGGRGVPPRNHSADHCSLSTDDCLSKSFIGTTYEPRPAKSFIGTAYEKGGEGEVP